MLPAALIVGEDWPWDEPIYTPHSRPSPIHLKKILHADIHGAGVTCRRATQSHGNGRKRGASWLLCQRLKFNATAPLSGAYGRLVPGVG